MRELLLDNTNFREDSRVKIFPISTPKIKIYKTILCKNKFIINKNIKINSIFRNLKKLMSKI